MQEKLNRYTFQTLIKECGTKKLIERGRELHDLVIKVGFECDIFIGSLLLDMYGKCGFIAESQELFDKLHSKDVVSWTSLVSAYVEQGQGSNALKCFEKMKAQCVVPNFVTYTCILKVCGSIEALDKGQEIHFHIIGQGYDSNPLAVGALVGMYAKCTYFDEALEILNRTPSVDVISWTTLMVRLVEHGFAEEALVCFDKLQKHGMLPDATTFTCGLKACADIREINVGQRIHAKIIEEEWETNISICNTLIDMYGKCGSLHEAVEVFTELPEKDLVSWNSLIGGYAEHGHYLEACNYLREMQLNGVLPSAVTFVCNLKACGHHNDGHSIHSKICKLGFGNNMFVENALIDMYMNFGLLADAFKVFDDIPAPNVATWTALIDGYADHEYGEEALYFLCKMVSQGVHIDIGIVVCGLKVCASIGDTNNGRKLHAMIIMEGIGKDASITNTLVQMYMKCGSVLDAVEMFPDLPTGNVSSWHSSMVPCKKQGSKEEIFGDFQTRQFDNASTYIVTFSGALKACCNVGALDIGQDLHGRIMKEGVEKDRALVNTLVDFYSKFGLLAEAHRLFDTLLERDVVTWTALITGYTCRGEHEHAFHLFERMRMEGIYPDEVTFLSILTVCSHMGIIDEGVRIFKEMFEKYNFLNVDHVNCIIDLFGRAGQLWKASDILENMPFQPRPIAWHTILGACRKWGDVQLARHVFDGALDSTENQISAFVLMLNIYADAEIWKEPDVELMEWMSDLI